MALQKLRKAQQENSFFPDWSCFACQDSGWISSHLVRMVPGYEEYNDHDCKNVTCPCNAKGIRHSLISSALDNSFTQEQKQWFHNYIREDWIKTNEAIANGKSPIIELRTKINTFIKNTKSI